MCNTQIFLFAFFLGMFVAGALDSLEAYITGRHVHAPAFFIGFGGIIGSIITLFFVK